MTISEDDLVSGEVLLAVEKTPEGAVPFRLVAPPELVEKTRVTPYRSGDRSGARLTFHTLTFPELEHLARALSPNGSRVQLHLKRSGSLVIFDGSMDLTPLASTDSSMLIELSAPGETTVTNGKDSAGMVTWSPEPGEVTQLSATYQFAAPEQDWLGWALLLGAVTMGTAALIAVLAQQAHERHRLQAGERSLGAREPVAYRSGPGRGR